MKIGISAFAGDGGRSGIGQYLAQIISRLPAHDANSECVVFLTRKAASELGLAVPGLRLVTTPDWIEQPIVNVAWHLLMLPLMLRLYGCDVVFLPAGNRRLGFWYGVPSVGTVHDLAQLHVANKYDGWRMLYAKKLLPALIGKLTKIISVSAATEGDLVTELGLDAKQIRTIPNGFDHDRFSAADSTSARARVSARWGVNEAYLLYVARLEHPGKNHVRLLEALASLKGRGHSIHLVMAGGAWTGAEAIYERVRELDLEAQVTFTGFVPDAELPDLYAAADAFVFPSLFEGFGIPPLEAMMSGIPVCASNRASIPEVVGPAGVLFDPEDPADIANAIESVVSDQELRRQLIAKGYTRARQFSWDTAAGRVMDVLREAAA